MRSQGLWGLCRVGNVIFLIFLILVGCAPNPATGRLEFNFIGTDTELKIGKGVFEYMDRETIESGPFIREGYAVDYIRFIVNRLYPYFHRRNVVPLNVVISPSAEPNAWALPGYVNVNIGLIPCLENEAQLAFVIGHEMGHVASRHTAERYSQTILANVVVTGASIYAGRLGELIGNVGGLLVLSAYSRAQEREADRIGFYYAVSAGYDSNEVVKSLLNVESCGKKYLSYLGIRETNMGGFLNRLFSDHPLTEERVKNLSVMASSKGKGVLNYGEYDSIKRWAEARLDILLNIDRALYVASKNRDTSSAIRELSRIEPRVRGMDIEPEIKAKFYAVKSYLYFNGGDYKSSIENAKLAVDYKKDFIVGYKIGGVAGLRLKTRDSIINAKAFFKDCLDISHSDQLCMKGALISSCLLKDGDCSYYCKKYFSSFSSDFPSVSTYCIF